MESLLVFVPGLVALLALGLVYDQRQRLARLEGLLLPSQRQSQHYHPLNTDLSEQPVTVANVDPSLDASSETTALVQSPSSDPTTEWVEQLIGRKLLLVFGAFLLLSSLVFVFQYVLRTSVVLQFSVFTIISLAVFLYGHYLVLRGYLKLGEAVQCLGITSIATILFMSQTDVFDQMFSPVLALALLAVLMSATCVSATFQKTTFLGSLAIALSLLVPLLPTSEAFHTIADFLEFYQAIIIVIGIIMASINNWDWTFGSVVLASIALRFMFLFRYDDPFSVISVVGLLIPAISFTIIPFFFQHSYSIPSSLFLILGSTFFTYVLAFIHQSNLIACAWVIVMALLHVVLFFLNKNLSYFRHSLTFLMIIYSATAFGFLSIHSSGLVVVLVAIIFNHFDFIKDRQEMRLTIDLTCRLLSFVSGVLLIISSYYSTFEEFSTVYFVIASICLVYFCTPSSAINKKDLDNWGLFSSLTTIPFLVLISFLTRFANTFEDSGRAYIFVSMVVIILAALSAIFSKLEKKSRVFEYLFIPNFVIFIIMIICYIALAAEPAKHFKIYLLNSRSFAIIALNIAMFYKSIINLGGDPHARNFNNYNLGKFLLLTVAAFSVFSLSLDGYSWFAHYKTDMQASLAVSIIAGVIGLMFVVFGFVKALAQARVAGLVIFMLVFGKVLLSDFANLDSGPRIISSFVSGIIFFFAAFLFFKVTPEASCPDIVIDDSPESPSNV
ncbi:hypothetical protein GEMRC1_002927 [Eukaryota sp. GEM-RC1]